MSDRTSSIKIGEFVLHVDRDHRGKFRGKQYMSQSFRGWHYHIEHPTFSQEEIMKLLEQELQEMGAVKIDEKKRIKVERRIYLHPGNLRKIRMINLDFKKAVMEWFLEKAKRKNIDKIIDQGSIRVGKKKISFMLKGKRKDLWIPKSIRNSFKGKIIMVKSYQKREGDKWIDISKEEWSKLHNFYEIVEEGKEYFPNVAIGIVEANPKEVTVWKLGKKTAVLWCSSITGVLHIEADKKVEFSPAILTKPVLIKILEKMSGIKSSKKNAG